MPMGRPRPPYAPKPQPPAKSKPLKPVPTPIEVAQDFLTKNQIIYKQVQHVMRDAIWYVNGHGEQMTCWLHAEGQSNAGATKDTQPLLIRTHFAIAKGMPCEPGEFLVWKQAKT